MREECTPDIFHNCLCDPLSTLQFAVCALLRSHFSMHKLIVSRVRCMLKISTSLCGQQDLGSCRAFGVTLLLAQIKELVTHLLT